MTIICYVGVYALSIVGGHLIAGSCIYLIRVTVKQPLETFTWLVFWVGGTERAVATTLVLFAPHYLPAFIGGWIALKFAANWQRRSEEGAREASLVALVGSVLSFAVAVAAALLIRPNAIAIWAN